MKTKEKRKKKKKMAVKNRKRKNRGGETSEADNATRELLAPFVCGQHNQGRLNSRY